MAHRLLAGRHRVRTLVLLLVLLPFFLSMLVTNDVALITFVPFAILVLHTIGQERLLLQVIVLQTMAANLGSMATPVGNPQNLFLYSQYQLSAGAFFSAMLPLTLASLAGLAALTLSIPSQTIQVAFPEEASTPEPKRLGIYLGLFLLCLLTVFRVLPYGVLTAVVVGSLLLVDRKVLSRVDYGLLFTFVCFLSLRGISEPFPRCVISWGDYWRQILCFPQSWPVRRSAMCPPQYCWQALLRIGAACWWG